LRYLGEVPADPGQQAEWVQRASAVAAYRDERGYAHETEAIGPAPERASPELRASWHAAYVALQMPDEHHEVAAASDGELWAWRADYERETAWAPPYVADELRAAHLAEDAYQADAVRARYRAGAAADRGEQEKGWQEAEQYEALAREVGARRAALTEVAEARRRWHDATGLAREKALNADAELRRRHPNPDLPLLHPGSQETSESDAARPQAEPTALDLDAALRAARQAEAIIAERQHQAGQDARQADGDFMRRRQLEAEQLATARRNAVRQDPAPSHQPAAELEHDEPELEAGR
jgi:hypothetical protein